MDVVSKAQIVWAETKDLSLAPGGDPATLTRLRILIAAIAEQAPRDLPNFETLPARDDPQFGKDVIDCGAVAETQVADALRNLCVILWPSGDGVSLKTDELAPPAPWDKLKLGGYELVGQYKVKDRTVSAFSRAFVAGEDAPRFISLVTGAGLKPGTGVYAPKPQLRRTVSRTARMASWVLIGLFVAVFSAASLWSLSVGSLAGSAVVLFGPTDCPTTFDKANPATFLGAPLAWLPDKTGANACQAAWREAETKALAANGDWWANTKSFFAKGAVSEATGAFSLRLPTLAAMASIVLLAVAAGLGVVGRPLGLFIDARNRMSLTRLQFAAWFAVLMGGLTSYSLFNVGFWGGDLARINAGLAFVQGKTDDKAFKIVSDALAQLVNFMPTMEAPLWALIGITGGTTIVSSFLLRPGEPEDPGAGTQVLPARRTQVATHADPAEADLSDIVYGETEEDAGVVDSTRLQAVAMTGLLVAVFGNVLLEEAEGIGGVTVLEAAHSGLQVFGKMPSAGGAFLTLLAATHGALVGGKLLGAYKGAAAKTP